jgi:rubrerythrin
MTTHLIGASVWEQDLYDHFTSHVANERDLLSGYQQAAADSSSPAFRYLTALIVEDEIRHHRMFEELASSLRTDAELRPQEPAIPYLDDWGGDPQRVIELTERLCAQEESDAAALKKLSRQLSDVKDTTLWQLLVKLMEMDTAKHIEILRFVRKHARPGRV